LRQIEGFRNLGIEGLKDRINKLKGMEFLFLAFILNFITFGVLLPDTGCDQIGEINILIWRDGLRLARFLPI
jgi:hypothetical protein